MNSVPTAATSGGSFGRAAAVHVRKAILFELVT